MGESHTRPLCPLFKLPGHSKLVSNLTLAVAEKPLFNNCTLHKLSMPVHAAMHGTAAGALGAYALVKLLLLLLEGGVPEQRDTDG